MSKLIITEGLPATGKSVFASRWVSEDPVNRRGAYNFETARVYLLQGFDVVLDADYAPDRERAKATNWATHEVEIKQFEWEPQLSEEKARVLYGKPTTGHNTARDLIARVMADVPTPAQVKAIAYLATPHPISESKTFVAGYRAGLEAARLAVYETGDGFEQPEEEAIKALLAAETPNQAGATT